MTNPYLDMMLDTQKSVQQEYFNNWGRLFNICKSPEVYRDLDVASTPHEVVYEEDALRLLRYRDEKYASDYAEPLLICFALVNRPYILDLQPSRSVVRQFLKRGHDVYLIDWGIPTAADRSMRIQDYVCGLMKNVVHKILKDRGAEQVNLLGYCMGGTMSTMFTALYPELIRNLILMAAPIDFSKDDTLLHLWTQPEYFDVDALIDAYGNCPGTFLQNAFQLMKPVRNYTQKYLNFYEKSHDDVFLENFFAMERWTNDNIPVAGETFREFVKLLYQQNRLVKGTFKLEGRKIDLKSIECPLLALVAQADHLVHPDSTLAILDHVSSTDKKKMVVEAGHIGLAVSRGCHSDGGIWPRTAMWLADRCSGKKKK